MHWALMTRVLQVRRRLRQRESWNRRRLEVYQAAALRDVRDFAYARSPFYQRFHKGLVYRPLGELPILTKAQVMEHFDALITDQRVRLAALQDHLATMRSEARFLGCYWVAATSGSTGRPGIFLWNMAEWAMVLASYARANEWAGLKVGLLHRMRLAVVSSRTPWHQSALVGTSLQSPVVPTLRLDATDPLPEIVERLNTFQPQALVAYASMARVLAEEQLAGRLCIAPQAVLSASEVLLEDTRQRIVQAWEQQPFNVYAATESAGVASECAHHAGMHLYEDLVITEVVDEEHRPVPPGTFGAKVLVTVLFSRTQPLIRYEMSDSLQLAEEDCPCGRPFGLIRAVQGRMEDRLRLPGRTGGEVCIEPNVLHNLLEALPVREWQIVQEPECLRVLLAGAQATFDADSFVVKLLCALERQGVAPLRIQIDRVPSILRTGIGKLPLIRSTTAASRTLPEARNGQPLSREEGRYAD